MIRDVIQVFCLTQQKPHLRPPSEHGLYQQKLLSYRLPWIHCVKLENLGLWNKNLLLCLEKMWLRNITSMLGHANTYMVYTSRLDQLYESVCTKLNTWNGLQQIQNWDRKTYPKMLVRDVFKWKNGNSLVSDQIWGPRRLYD